MLKRLSLALVTVMFVVSACKKSDRQNDTDTQSSTDYLQAQTYFLNTSSQVFDLLRNRPEIYLDADTINHYPGSCPAITITPAYPDSTTFPKTILIDYGTSNCTGSDGFTRRGKLNVVLNSNPTFQGVQITINPIGFFINDKEVRGGITLFRETNTSTGHPKYTETVSQGEIHVTDKDITYFKHNVTREMITGDTTRITTDNEYTIKGSGSGYGTKGTNFTFTIENHLNLKPGCAYIDNGSVSLRPGNLSERKIDLGTGCNAAAAVTIFGVVNEITVN